jgi:hypothetical protein
MGYGLIRLRIEPFCSGSNYTGEVIVNDTGVIIQLSGLDSPAERKIAAKQALRRARAQLTDVEYPACEIVRDNPRAAEAVHVILGAYRNGTMTADAARCYLECPRNK